CYVAPDILSTDETLTASLEQIDAYCNAEITYDIEGEDCVLTSEKISSMIVVSTNGTVSIDEDAVASYVQTLATAYNTYGDVRSFTTTLGDIIEIGGGDYGWVIDKSGEAEQILSDLEGGEPVTREPVYEQTAMVSGLNDIGTTYVELDYTNQHMYYYVDGELILDSDIVSGKISNGNGSPDGVFKIVYKQRNATLVGENYSSAVDYFMPFAYNVGIHDASWRSSFGGEIYKSSGSHGCINVPASIAKELYGMIEVGTPVVAYYREAVELTSESSKISNAYSYVSTEDEE
ncbi:MAG: L,D-transpeptidase/peptidoglycan binding protein, partial [Clostridiales bacterium]|nr:L,D-transpeptidase/peptidoglycan binding protein [Clostridiales bacterium]